MKTIRFNSKVHKIIKTLETTDRIYYYTIVPSKDNEVVFLYKDVTNPKAKLQQAEERDYPVLMNKFSLK